MSLQNTGSIGSLVFQSNTAKDGYHVPRITLKPIKTSGMAGDLLMWDNYQAPISEVVTETFTIKDDTAESFESAVISYIGTQQSFIVNMGSSTAKVYIAFVIDAKIQHKPCLCSEDETVDTKSIVNWELKLYEQ